VHIGMTKELTAALVVVVCAGVVGAVAIIVLVVEIYWAEVVAQSVRWLWQWGHWGPGRTGILRHQQLWRTMVMVTSWQPEE
jgi:hypothetical protein